MEPEALIQYCWTLVCAALVLFMQAGFCCLEAGMVRHKNSINVALKNIADMCCSVAAFFIIGFGLMFGATQSGFIGTPQWFLQGADPDTILFFLFQVTFCATAATIVSGGVAERCRFLPYVIASIVIGIAIYPTFGHWVWGGGWLSEFGYHDFAGSSVVHMVGAGVALAGIQVLGARAGRFAEDGRPRPIAAANMPLVAIGVVILTFGWIGFNGGSGALSAETPMIVTNTLLAACAGGVTVMLLSWAYGGLAQADLVLNGVLGGLVAITAGADAVTPQASMIIGAAGGVAVVVFSDLLLRLKLDDAVGAVPVHGAAGFVGVVLTGVFASSEAITAWGLESRAESIGVQALGATVCFAWSYGTGLIMWFIISKIITLRVGVFEEQVGLNYSEHQVSSSIHDLTTALTQAEVLDDSEVLRRVDNAGTGETAALAQEVRRLIRSSKQQLTSARQVATALGELHGRLADQQIAGSQTADRCRQLTNEVGNSLDKVLDYLRDHQHLDSAVPLISDLLGNTRQRLKELSETLPGQENMWRGLDSAIRQIDDLMSGLKGARA